MQTGRYAKVCEVSRTALCLLQQAERLRQDTVSMLQAEEVEGNEAGFITVDVLGAELDALIGEAGRPP
ncbi:MAG: type II toxin-antitoxin system ParD family antitoxin [Paracraurococcus sp.]